MGKNFAGFHGYVLSMAYSWKPENDWVRIYDLEIKSNQKIDHFSWSLGESWFVPEETKFQNGDLIGLSDSLLDSLFLWVKKKKEEDSKACFRFYGKDLISGMDSFVEDFKRLERFSFICIGKKDFLFPIAERDKSFAMYKVVRTFLAEIREEKYSNKSFRLTQEIDLIRWGLNFGLLEIMEGKDKITEREKFGGIEKVFQN